MNAARPSERALLVHDVFHRCVDARIRFNEALMRCARKGWPDKSGAIDTAFKAQEGMLKRLGVRLSYLVREHACTDAEWHSYTTTALVHTRVQEDWKEQDEAALVKSDPQYSALNQEIEELRRKADPDGLEGPYRMALRDPELVDAGWALDRQVRQFDQELGGRQL
jgi:hypothetical protein